MNFGDSLPREVARIALGIAMLGVGPAPAYADFVNGPLPGKFTGNIKFMSDYIVGGASASNNEPTVQGGFDWNSDNGFGLGVSATGVNFRTGNPGRSEFHFNGKYGGSIDQFYYEIGGHYFWYPDAPHNFNFWASHAKVGYDFGLFKFDTTFFPAGTYQRVGKAAYVQNIWTVPITPQFKIETDVDYFIRDHHQKNWSDWNIGGTLNVFNWFDLDLRYFNSDLRFLGNLSNSRIVIKLSRTF